MCESLGSFADAPEHAHKPWYSHLKISVLFHQAWQHEVAQWSNTIVLFIIICLCMYMLWKKVCHCSRLKFIFSGSGKLHQNCSIERNRQRSSLLSFNFQNVPIRKPLYAIMELLKQQMRMQLNNFRNFIRYENWLRYVHIKSLRGTSFTVF